MSDTDEIIAKILTAFTRDRPEPNTDQEKSCAAAAIQQLEFLNFEPSFENLLVFLPRFASTISSFKCENPNEALIQAKQRVETCIAQAKDQKHRWVDYPILGLFCYFWLDRDGRALGEVYGEDPQTILALIEAVPQILTFTNEQGENNGKNKTRTC